MNVTNLYTIQKKNIIKQRYDEIYTHELAHKNAAGSFGGPIVIEKNNEGIPTGGHVEIQMPKLDHQNPDKTIKHADTVIKAALAPSDPSAQDYKVANEARSIRNQAQDIKNKNKLNYLA